MELDGGHPLDKDPSQTKHVEGTPSTNRSMKVRYRAGLNVYVSSFSIA